MRRHLLLIAAFLGFAAPVSAQTTQAVLDSVQRTAFQYLWLEANPANGMVRDRSQSGSPASIAAIGFALSAIPVGIDHGWITREQGRDRVLTTLQTFWTYPQGQGDSFIGYKGLFYHFLSMSTALRMPGWNPELSTIDTALLFGGMLHAREYFTSSDASETQIRALADSIYLRADWKFMQNSQAGIKMGWKPTTGFSGFGTWVGYNEAMILYILALGSPTHPPTTGTPWTTWTSNYNWSTQYGQTFLIFPPLFGHQYSHCWIDFRYIKDSYMQGKGITYFENSRRATLAQRAYCIANPKGWPGYSDSLWGLTASDGPPEDGGYRARGAPPAENDSGTIAPTAATSSIPFAPEVCIPAIRNMYMNYPSLWGKYGFRDAFSVRRGWYDTDWLGIDQGPIVLMIENYYNGSIWNRFMLNPYVKVGLQAAGFVRTTGVGDDLPSMEELSLLPNEPNPFRDETTLQFRLASAGSVKLTLYDVAGREVARLVDGVRPAGLNRVKLAAGALQSGVYYYRLDAAGRVDMRRCVLLR